jgi:hypothetical protein
LAAVVQVVLLVVEEVLVVIELQDMVQVHLEEVHYN